jgi:hypothetical protein
MRRYPSLSWEYGPKTREILAARELAASNNPEEEVTTDAEEHPRCGCAEATATPADQEEEAEQIARWERGRR